MKKLIAKTATGEEVFVIENNKHMIAHSDVSEQDIAEAVSKIEYTPTFWMGTVELDHIVGKDACVEVTPDDEICLIARPGRDIKSRMVLNRKPVDTNKLTIGICIDDDGKVTVFTAFPGMKAPKELTDPSLKPEEREESERFWATHALCATE